MLATTAAGLGKYSRSRLQLIYFLIATSNISATLCGLYLSHVAISIYQTSTENAAAFDAKLNDSAKLQRAALDAHLAYVSSTDAEALVRAKARIASQAIAFRRTAAQFDANLATFLEPSQSKPARAQLAAMGAAMTELESISAFDMTATGRMARFNATYERFQASAHELDDLISQAKTVVAAKTNEQIGSLRNYELLVYALLALVISCGVYFGYFIGKVLERKFSELEKKNVELEEAHEQALAFSREIQVVNGDMGQLNRQLNENLTKLREAQDEVLRKGKMAQLGNLTATVAHELRNPLSTVRTSVFMLARKIKDQGLGLDPQLQRINNGIVRCDNIITQLLDFSRSRAVKLEPIVLDDWLEKLVQAEAPKLPDALSIECYFGLGDRLVNIEPGRLERAVINLLSNASEALLGKGDDPKARYRDNPVVKLSTQLSARGIEIVVGDNGPGIPPDILAKIREPLFTTKNFGTGLGIPAVEQILEQHGGGMEISSEDGQGAAFTLWLPVSHAVEKVA
jgi:signal transduction histidine kinase